MLSSNESIPLWSIFHPYSTTDTKLNISNARDMRPRNSKRISKLPYHRPIAVWEPHLGMEVENLNKIHFQHALIHQTLQIIPKSLEICINLLQKSSDSVHSPLKVFESIFKFLKGSSDPFPSSSKDFERLPTFSKILESLSTFSNSYQIYF